MPVRQWTEWDDRALLALHDGGWPVETAAWYLDRTPNAIHQHARKLGVAFKGPQRTFTPDEDEAIRLNYPDLPTLALAYVLDCDAGTIYRRAYALGLKKSAKFKRSKWAARWNPDHPAAVAHRFKKGHVPANKGMRRPGWAPGRMRATQFKKGQMAGAAQYNWVPIGTERIKDGVLCRKMTDDPSMYPARRWTPVHRLVWESVHGPVPAGHVVRFLPGTKTFIAAEITVDKLELVTFAENMRRNSIHNHPPELRKAMQLRGVLNRAINRVEKRGKPT